MVTGLAVVLALLVPTTASAADRDGDGLRDAFERKYGVTSPKWADSDRDGVIDSAEDNDWDRLSNLAEQRFGTDPGNPDTDGDGQRDGGEDHDRDGIVNARQQDRRPLPAGLRPSLARAPEDFGNVAAGCSSELGSSALLVCGFGPTGRLGRVVLMGDSHAGVLVDPFQRAARADGWRLTTMIKGSCLPIPGMIPRGQFEVDRGRSCRAWREQAIAELNRRPPDLLVITASKSYRTQRLNGTGIAPFRVPGLWEKGIKRLVRQLPKTTRLLVLGDVPQNAGQPVDCLRGNTDDMSRCLAPRVPPGERPVEVAQRKAAKATDQYFGSLYYKICSYDPCPLVQGDVLIWRDKSHLTGTFARKLTPAVRQLITPYLRGEIPTPDEPEAMPEEEPAVEAPTAEEPIEAASPDDDAAASAGELEAPDVDEAPDDAGGTGSADTPVSEPSPDVSQS